VTESELPLFAWRPLTSMLVCARRGPWHTTRLPPSLRAALAAEDRADLAQRRADLARAVAATALSHHPNKVRLHSVDTNNTKTKDPFAALLEYNDEMSDEDGMDAEHPRGGGGGGGGGRVRPPVPRLYARSVPVYPYSLAATSSPAWPLVP